MKLIQIFILTVSCLYVGQLAAQTPFFQEYSISNRKDNVQVNRMTQDIDGFVWFATNKGLFRFDGKKYVKFTRNDSLADDHVISLALDSIGRLWTGHANGKISIVHNSKITAFDPEEGNSTKPISDILFDSKGVLWFSTLNDGIYYYVHDRLYRIDELEGLPDLYVYDLAEMSDGKIAAGTDGGLAIIDLKDRKVSVEVIDHKSGLPDNIVRKILAEENELWLGTQDAGVVVYNLSSKIFKRVGGEGSKGPVSDMARTSDELWVASLQHGLLLFDKASGVFRDFRNQTGKLSASEWLMIDEESNVWSAGRSSVVRTSGTSSQFVNTVQTGDENVLAVTTDKSGNIWFSNREGLFAFDGKNFKQKLPSSLRHLAIISLYTDERGVIWAGLYGEGILRIDPETMNIRQLSKELRNGNVLNITGKGNTVWLATLGGVTRIVEEAGKTAITSLSKEHGLSSDFIYQVFVDSKGRVWFSTDGKGVDMMDETGIHNVTDGLPVRIVYGVTEAADGTILANVQGNGLYRFDGQKSFVPYTAKPTRKGELHAVTTDRQGNLIVFHDDGVDMINPAKGHLRYLGEESGMRDRVANLNAVNISGDGKIIAGTSDGILMFDQASRLLSADPLPRIPSARVGNKLRDIAGIGDLTYDENNITFNIVGIWYQNPESLFFQYKLEHYDEHWIATRDNAVTYSKLPPGDYIFKLRVSESEDFSSADETFVAFTVHPPFWRTNIFYFLCAITLALGGYGVVKYRERNLRYSNMILEARVRARTQEVQRQNDEIQAQNEEITAQAEEIKGINENLEMLVVERTAELERKNKALEEYAFINAHKLRSPVASILGLAHLLTKTSLDEDGKEITKRLQQSADELDDIVRSITKAIERGEKPTIFYPEKEE
jgi:ligand-binding sensor domain-containing protein